MGGKENFATVGLVDPSGLNPVDRSYLVWSDGSLSQFKGYTDLCVKVIDKSEAIRAEHELQA